MAKYDPGSSVGTITKLLLLAAVAALVVALARADMHNRALKSMQTNAVLGVWEGKNVVNVLTEYAPLPAYDRGLIEEHCSKVHDAKERLRGTTEILKHNVEPVCQALMRGGWQPNWSVRTHLAWLAQQ